MTTLITGATGFVGGRVARAFTAAGHSVKLTSRSPESSPGKAFVKMPEPDAPDEAFEALMDNVDHVVHCAALNNDAPGATDEEFRLANVVLTRRLVRAASQRITGRFIYISSSHAAHAGAPGSREERKPTAYSRSKGDGERAVLEGLSHLPDRDAAILRLPPVYGVGMKNRLALLLKLAKLPIPLPVTGLEREHSIVSSDAVADAVLHLVFRLRSLQPVYFASDAAAASVPDIIGAFREGLGRRRLIFPLPGSRTLKRVMRDRGKPLNNRATQDLSLLAREGWTPEDHTMERLRELARLSAS